MVVRHNLRQNTLTHKSNCQASNLGFGRLESSENREKKPEAQLILLSIYCERVVRTALGERHAYPLPSQVSEADGLSLPIWVTCLCYSTRNDWSPREGECMWAAVYSKGQCTLALELSPK